MEEYEKLMEGVGGTAMPYGTDNFAWTADSSEKCNAACGGD